MLTIVCLCIKAEPLIKAPSMYVYGISFSATDSIIYMTEVYKLEDAQITKKSKFLYGRNELSSQLKQHMYMEGFKKQTCTVSFDINKTKAEKKYLKQKAYFLKKGYVVKFIHPDNFKFKTVKFEGSEEDLEFVGK